MAKKTKAEFYWRIVNPEEGQDPFNLVVAPNIQEAIRIYLSQYDYLNMEDITRVEQVGTVLIEIDNGNDNKDKR